MGKAKKLKIGLSTELKRLELVVRDLITLKFIGTYKSVFRGKGLEFEDYRKYTESDDASLIDWKASARAKEILIKEFVEERKLKVFFLIDGGSSMLFASTPKLKSEYAAELVASLAYAILMSGDFVGFSLFTNKPIKEVPFAMGMTPFYDLLKTLANPRNYGGKFDFISALKFLSTYVEEGTLVIIVSDFIMTKGNWKEYLKISAEKFDIIGMMIRDPIDQTLPKGRGQVVLADPISGKRMIIEPNLVRGAYAKAAKREVEEIKQAFLMSNSDFLQLSTDKSFLAPLIKLFQWRTRK